MHRSGTSVSLVRTEAARRAAVLSYLIHRSLWAAGGASLLRLVHPLSGYSGGTHKPTQGEGLGLLGILCIGADMAGRVFAVYVLLAARGTRDKVS